MRPLERHFLLRGVRAGHGEAGAGAGGLPADDVTARPAATANSMATANAVAMALECLLLALEQHLHDCEQHHHDLSHRLRLLLASLLSLALGGQSSR